MIKITYRIENVPYKDSKRRASLVRIEGGVLDEVLFRLERADRAALVIGKKRYAVAGGLAKVPFGELEDGILRPSFIIDGEQLPAEPIEKNGLFILRAPFGEGFAAEIDRAFAMLESRMRAAEAELRELKKYFEGRPLLEFIGKGEKE